MGIRRVNQGIKRHPSPSSVRNSYNMAAGQSRRFLAWQAQAKVGDGEAFKDIELWYDGEFWVD